jgi:hypothetical protein
MTKSFTILEFVLVLVISSLILIVGTNYILNSFSFYKKTKISTVSYLSLSNSIKIIEKHLSMAIFDSINQINNKMTWIERIENYHYSNYIDLNSADTSKFQIYSPSSQFNLIDFENVYALFSTNKIYKVQVKDNQTLTFEDDGSKTISSKFDLIKKDNALEFIDNKLFLNQKLLIDDILSFDIDFIDKKILINICNLDNFCQKSVI